MALQLDGRKLSKEIEQRLNSEIINGLKQGGRPPGLAVLRIGDDPASAVYVSNKEKACSRVGVKSFESHLPGESSQEDVIQKIREFNDNDLIDGILLQLPLPMGMDEGVLLAEIDPLKDVDGLNALNLGKLVKGEPGPRSCTPAGVMALLAANQIMISGQRAVVIGRSILVGRPMALMLEAANATVSVAHSKTTNLVDLTRQAELLIVAAGKKELIGANHISKGAVVVDVGIHRIETPNNENGKKVKLCGDVSYQEVEPLVSAITPVPGGVGPMTVAMLLVNTVCSWQISSGLPLTLEDLLP